MKSLFKAALQDMLGEAGMLLEDRLEFTYKRYEGKISKEDFDIIVGFDPTVKKLYIDWMVRMVVKGNLKMEDLDRTGGDLHVFDRVKARMPGQMRDINHFKSPEELFVAIEPYAESKSGKELRRDEDAEFKKDITVVYSGPEGSVKIPKTKEASCFLGRGTRWCTAANNSYNYFDDYHRRGDLFVFAFADGTKWQAHMDHLDLMDERDVSVQWKKLTETSLWKKVENYITDYVMKRHPDSVYKYAMEVLTARNARIERGLIDLAHREKTANGLVNYAAGKKFRWHEVEPLIIEYFTMNNIMRYIRDCVHGRWAEAEKKILQTSSIYNEPSDIRQYVQGILKARWPQLEAVYEATNSYDIAYHYFVEYVPGNPGRWPYLEKELLEEYMSSLDTHRNVRDAATRCRAYSKKIGGWPEYDNKRSIFLANAAHDIMKSFKVEVKIRDKNDLFASERESKLFPGRRIVLNWDYDAMLSHGFPLAKLDTDSYVDIWKEIGIGFVAKKLEQTFKEYKIVPEDHIEPRILSDTINRVEGMNALQIDVIGKHFGAAYHRLQKLTSGPGISQEDARVAGRDFTEYANGLNR